MTARDRFHVHQRVQLSAIGRQYWDPKYHQQIGTVTGFSGDGLVRVKWDGRTSTTKHGAESIEAAPPAGA